MKLLLIFGLYLNFQYICCQQFPVRFWQPQSEQQQFHQQGPYRQQQMPFQQQLQQPQQPQFQPQQPQQSQQQQQHIPLPPPPPNFRFIPFEDEERVVEERRWSLIPTRSTTKATLPPTTTPEATHPPPTTPSSTTTSTTTTTTTPPPPPLPSTTIVPYYDPCEFYDDIALLNKLKQSGLYNSIYMAPDVFTAAKTFPDLGDRSFTISGGHKYECDEQCEKESKIIRSIIGSNTRRSVQRSQIMRNSGFRAPRVTEAPRTWWRPANWRREKREDGFDKNESQMSPINDTTTVSHHHREKRSAAELAILNSGKTDGILGTTIALQCDEATTEEIPSNGYHLCRNCRAVRQLPDTYFPRVLNEVICAEGNCLRGDGKCQQRYLPFRILQNVGNSRCPQWRETDIQIRTCCDCVIHPNSPFIKYIIPPD